MYYKIENKDCKVYKELVALREKELIIEKENMQTIKEKSGSDFQMVLADHGQQNFRRVTQYSGFGFTEPEKLDLKAWKYHKDHVGIYVPNRRTKIGQEMSRLISNGLKSSSYMKVSEILSLPETRRFTFPFVDVVNEIVLLMVGDNQEPKNKDVIEITKTEFNKLRAK